MTLIKKYYIQIIWIYIVVIVGLVSLLDIKKIEAFTHVVMSLITMISIFSAGNYLIENQNKLQFSKIFFSLGIFFYLVEVVSTDCRMEFYEAVPYAGMEAMIHFIRNGMLVMGVIFGIIDYGEKWNKLRLIIDLFVLGFFVSYISWHGFIKIYYSISLYENFQRIFSVLYVATDALIIFLYVLIYLNESNYFSRKSNKMKVLAFSYILFSDMIYFYSITENIYYPYMLNKLMPIAFFLIALSFEDEDGDLVRPNISHEKDKYIMIILVASGVISIGIKPNLSYAALFILMCLFRMFSNGYTRNYELSEQLTVNYIQANHRLKEKAEELNSISLELENRIVQRTRELEKINRELIDFANVDMLTKLPNRMSFISELDRIVELQLEKFAVLFLDVDRFKTINDWYGHEVGDYVVAQISRRIKSVIDEGDIVARLGGDEFGIIINNFQDRMDILNFSEKLLSHIRRPFITKDRKIFVTASIGIAIYPEHARGRTMLMKYADIALYKSKATGKDRLTIYDLMMRKSENRRLEIENMLYSAIDKQEFSINFRPQINIGSLELKTLESFIKWDSEIIGSVDESEFLGIAEESGLIIQMGKILLEESIKAIKYLNEKYKSDIAIAVNISPRQFMEPKFVEDISSYIKKYDINPKWLEIEVTEDLIMSNEEVIITRLNEVSSLGITIVLDKFGKGYSSFVHLKKLPIDKLKLESEFINNLDKEEDYKIVRAILLMCRYMGVNSVAESVSSERQIEILKQIECDFVQGEIYGVNLDIDSVEKGYFVN